MVKKLLTLLLCALTALVAVAQETDYIKYQQEAGPLSGLFRGKLRKQYMYRYNGHCYWESPDYKEGSVYYNGKEYPHVLLNIDACQMDLLARPSADVFPIALYTDEVSWFKIGDALYINLKKWGWPGAPDGFVQVLKDGSNPILLQVRKIFTKGTGNHNGTDIGYVDTNYQPDLVNYFAYSERYFTLENGQIVKLKKNAALKALKSPATGAPVFGPQLPGPWTGNATPAPLPSEKIGLKGAGLPDGYFDPAPKEAVETSSDTRTTASYKNKTYVIGSQQEKADKVTVSGTVTDLETEEPLPGVVIFDSNSSTYTRTSAQGRYAITLPAGENILNFSYEGKEETALRVLLQGNGTLDVQLPERITVLKAAVVSATSMENHRTASMGVETVSIGTLTKIPSAFGEGDILKAVLTLPGVKTVGEASGGFNVRGGSQDQNLILFNGNTIYNPSHLFGIFSAFNPDIVDNVELFKSSIPARYGGRISSVLTVHSKDGSLERFKGSLGIGLITGRLHLEGPIIKGKTSFAIAARTTYSDWLLRMLPKNSNYAGGRAGFTDGNLLLTHHFNEHNSLRASAYLATDSFSPATDTLFRYTNINASLQFRHKGEAGNTFQVSAGYDQYGNTSGDYGWEAGAYDLNTFIRQAFLRATATHPIGHHTLEYGVDAVGFALDPGILTPHGVNSGIQARALAREWAVEPDIHLSDTWEPSPRFSIEGGIRLSSYGFLNAQSKWYFGPEFRASMRYSPADNLSIKAGVNTMRQYIHLISNTSAISPMDTWKLSDASLRPTTGWQAAAGVYWTMLSSGIDFSLEGYWKQTQNALDYKPGAKLSMNEHLADELIPVFGRAWGVEAMIKKTTGKLTGWMSYSYSRAAYREMGDRGFAAIAHGDWYNAPFDKPHEFKLSANWAMTHRFSLSANVDYSTGRPVTIPVGQYYLDGMYRMAYSQRNGYRIPDYFRLDLALNIDPRHKKTSFLHYTITLGVYNVTGRKNPYSVFFKTTPSGEVKGYMLSVFATQVPYINLNLLF